MFDESMVEFLHTGCALLVGTVDEAGRPRAGRAWGLSVLDASSGRVRLLVDADDSVTLASLRPGGAIAITTASVRTLHSVQMKGKVAFVEAANDADEEKRKRYTNDFITDIHETDGDPLEMLSRWSAHAVVACIVDVDEAFDQTPGPSAGSPIGATR